MTEHPWRLVAFAFAAGASLGRRRDPVAIARNMIALAGELLAVLGAGRNQSWIDLSERLATKSRFSG